MSDPVNTVNTVCTEVFGTAPDSVRRAEVGMVNTVCILTVGIGKYILRLNPEKASRIMQEAVYLKSYFECLRPVSYLDDISMKNLLISGGRVSGVIDIDEVGFGDPMTFVALTRTALLGMGRDDNICGYLLNAMGADETQRTAEAFYSLMYCADLMSERGMTFNGRKFEVSKDVIDRFNAIYETFIKNWEERKKML